MTDDIRISVERQERNGTVRWRVRMRSGARSLRNATCHSEDQAHRIAAEWRASLATFDQPDPVVRPLRPVAPGEIQHETLVLVMADAHCGARGCWGPDYHARWRRIGERIVTIVDHLAAGIQFDALRIWMLGDMVDGSGIYPGQEHEQDETDAHQQVLALHYHITDAFLPPVQERFSFINIDAVPGNHGRAGKHKAQGENADTAFYDALKLSGLKVEHQAGVWMRISEYAYGHRAVLYHGHKVPSLLARQRRVRDWYMMPHVWPFAVSPMGHIHTCYSMYVGPVLHLCTGTMKLRDKYAEESGYSSTTAWWLFGASPSRPATARWELELT